MPINLTQPVPGKTVEETIGNVISALRQQQMELEHYLSHLDTDSLVSYKQKPLTQGPSEWEDVATNFNIAMTAIRPSLLTLLLQVMKRLWTM